MSAARPTRIRRIAASSGSPAVSPAFGWIPATAEPGWESWLLVKLMYFGRVRYSPAVSLTVA